MIRFWRRMREIYNQAWGRVYGTFEEVWYVNKAGQVVEHKWVWRERR